MRMIICGLITVVFWLLMPSAFEKSTWLGAYFFFSWLFSVGVYAYYIPTTTEIKSSNKQE